MLIRFLCFSFLFCSWFGFSQEDDLSSPEKNSESFVMGLANQYIDEMSKKNAFSVYTAEEMRVIVRQNARGKFMEKVFMRFPKTEDFMCHWLVDETALPKFISIMKQKDRLKNVSIIMFVILILGYLISSYSLRKEKSWLKRISYSLLHGLLISCVSTIFFYFSFKSELEETVRIARQTLF